MTKMLGFSVFGNNNSAPFLLFLLCDFALRLSAFDLIAKSVKDEINDNVIIFYT